MITLISKLVSTLYLIKKTKSLLKKKEKKIQSPEITVRKTYININPKNSEMVRFQNFNRKRSWSI